MNEGCSGITQRKIQPQDEPFVFRVFAATHGLQFHQACLPEPMIRQLLEQQYRGQQSQFRAHYPDADYDLVLSAGIPIGYIYTNYGPASIALIDIALLPERRGQGTGTQVVRKLIEQSNAYGKPIDAHVAKGGRAWGLWQQLGFKEVADYGVHLVIVRRPD
ncbi:MAG: GNAT family N-acetyltransferase [Motiliproteus sp.]